MTRMLLRTALLTLGDPHTLTGGYLYHLRLAELAPAHAASLQFVSVPRRPFPLAALLDGPRTLRAAEALGVDALVLDSIAAAFLGPALLMRRPRIPVVGMLHQPPGGIDHGPLRSTVQAALDRLAYRHTQALLVASDSLAADLASHGIPPHRLRVVPPGRDVAATPLEPLERAESGQIPAPAALATPLAPRKPGEPLTPVGDDLRQGRRIALLCVGNWVERKGILPLLDAVARLSPDAATLHLVGNDQADPVYATRVRARLAAPDLAPRVVIHGPLPRESVAALYAAADVFALPSLKEPYGTVYGEAMAFGLPVVGWRAGNLPHLAEHSREGLILPPGDVAALTHALAQLAEDAPLRHQMGQAARQRALTRPTWQQSAEMFFTAIRELVEAHP